VTAVPREHYASHDPRTFRTAEQEVTRVATWFAAWRQRIIGAVSENPTIE
jgi:hypothetical protein